MKLVEFVECELGNESLCERSVCYVNPNYITYVEESEDFAGYSYIGIAGGQPTIVKGTAKEIKSKIEGKKWHKILRLR